jgi:hypothetical protein
MLFIALSTSNNDDGSFLNHRFCTTIDLTLGFGLAECRAGEMDFELYGNNSWFLFMKDRLLHTFDKISCFEHTIPKPGLDAPIALHRFAKQERIPDTLLMDFHQKL